MPERVSISACASEYAAAKGSRCDADASGVRPDPSAVPESGSCILEPTSAAGAFGRHGRTHTRGVRRAERLARTRSQRPRIALGCRRDTATLARAVASD